MALTLTTPEQTFATRFGILWCITILCLVTKGLANQMSLGQSFTEILTCMDFGENNPFFFHKVFKIVTT